MVQQALTLSSTNLVTISHAGKSCTIPVSSSDAPFSLGDHIQDAVGVPVDPHDLNADRRVLRLVETLPRPQSTGESMANPPPSNPPEVQVFVRGFDGTVHAISVSPSTDTDEDLLPKLKEKIGFLPTGPTFFSCNGKPLASGSVLSDGSVEKESTITMHLLGRGGAKSSALEVYEPSSQPSSLSSPVYEPSSQPSLVYVPRFTTAPVYVPWMNRFFERWEVDGDGRCGIRAIFHQLIYYGILPFDGMSMTTDYRFAGDSNSLKQIADAYVTYAEANYNYVRALILENKKQVMPGTNLEATAFLPSATESVKIFREARSNGTLMKTIIGGDFYVTDDIIQGAAIHHERTIHVTGSDRDVFEPASDINTDGDHLHLRFSGNHYDLGHHPELGSEHNLPEFSFKSKKTKEPRKVSYDSQELNDDSSGEEEYMMFEKHKAKNKDASNSVDEVRVISAKYFNCIYVYTQNKTSLILPYL